MTQATAPPPMPCTTPEDLDALPDGTIYVSAAQGVAEQKMAGLWYAAGCAEPYEPALPGTAYTLGA